MFLGLVSVAGLSMVSVVAGKRFYLLFMVSVVFLFYGFRRGKERFACYGFRRWFFNGLGLLQDRGCLSDGNSKTKTSGRFRDKLSIYIYIYIYINTYDHCCYNHYYLNHHYHHYHHHYHYY